MNVKQALVVVAFLAATGTGAPVSAVQTVSEGYDLFETDPGETDLLGIMFRGHPGPPSLFEFVAPPASAAGMFAIGKTDTIVHRLESASGEIGETALIPIELVDLSLVSVDPVAGLHPLIADQHLFVTLQKDRDPEGELRLNLDHNPPLEEALLPAAPPADPFPRSLGQMAIFFASSDGGTFDSTFLVFADVRLEDGTIVCGGPVLPACSLPPCGAIGDADECAATEGCRFDGSCTIDPPDMESFDSGLILQSLNALWAREPAPDSIRIQGVNRFLAGPGDVSEDFWGGVEAGAAPIATCVAQDAEGSARLVSCPTFCEVRTESSCSNSQDDDCNGLIDECSESGDGEGPVVTAPASLLLQCPQPDVSPAVTGQAIGANACQGPVSVTFNDFRTDRCGATFSLDRVWIGTDACGNESLPVAQRIDVVDTVPPEMICPGAAVHECTGPVTDVSPAVSGSATATDACNPPAISSSDAVTPQCGFTFTVTRTWTADDQCLTSDCAQSISVIDTTPPQNTCPGDTSVLWTVDRSPASQGLATGADICGAVSTGFSDSLAPGVCKSAVITRTWTATDECSNETPCEQVIDVRGPADAIVDLRALLGSSQIAPLDKGLDRMLSAALNATCADRADAASRILEGLVRVLKNAGATSPNEAAALIDAAQAIATSLRQDGACENGCSAF